MSRADRVTSTDYAHPRRPLPLRAFNRLAPRVHPEITFDPDTLMDEARAATGLSDFGDPSFLPALRMLTRSIAREANLHAVGTAIMRGRLVSTLQNRLRVEAAIAANPAVLDLPIRRPIVIAGLQRTGTTVLHRLLAADPGARALASWEALHPAPMPLDGPSARRRRAEAKLAELGLEAIAPEFFAIHPVEADAPEEDVLLLDHAFTSQAPEATMHVPTYASFLEREDLTPSYRYLKRILQLLTSQHAGEHWVLKTPHHMEYLAELLAVFPDAVIVQTHRDPQATMGSFCSMVAHGRGVFSEHVDPREVGTHWLRKVRRMIDRSLAVRDARGGTSFVDASYYDICKDPIAEVRRIYAEAGMELTSEAEAAMRAVSERDVQNRYGKHDYRTRDFGLSPTLIEETFADYRARFSIRREKGEKSDELAPPPPPTGVGHKSVVAATVTAVLDTFEKHELLSPLRDSVRLDGKTALVTGANSGLGKAVAIDLARRGARVLMACRSGIPEAGQDVARESGSTNVEMLRVDLSDLESVVALTDLLAKRKETIDLLVCNAGLMPSKAQKTKQGFEVMFAVHYAANHVLVRRLLESGVIPNDVYARNGRRGSAIPRIVFVSSETHRSSDGVDFERFGEYVDYGIKDGIAKYGDSKLVLCTLASALDERLRLPSGPSVAVHSLCPGPIDSGITRDAPKFLMPIIAPVMSTFFPSPADAAKAVVYLAAAPELSGDSGFYLHQMRRKAASALATSKANTEKLWSRGESLLAPYIARGRSADRSALPS